MGGRVFEIGTRLDVTTLELPEGRVGEVVKLEDVDGETVVHLKVGKWILWFGESAFYGCPVLGPDEDPAETPEEIAGYAAWERRIDDEAEAMLEKINDARYEREHGGF